MIYFSVGALLFQIILSIILISLICRHNPDDHRSIIFQKMMYSFILWAAYDFLMFLNQRFLPPELSFRLYGILSFMFLAFPPLAIKLILSLIRELTEIEKKLIAVPYIFLYLVVLVFPELSSAKTFGIQGGYQGSLPPWNICFKILGIGGVSISVVLLLVSSFKDTDKILRKEKRLFSLGVVLCDIGIIMSQVLIQKYPGLPWFANSSTALFSIPAFFALKKYGRLLSSRVLYETTVKISPNGISHVLNNRIVWMNKSMASLLNIMEGEKLLLKDMIPDHQPAGMSKRQILEDISNGAVRGKVIYIRNNTGSQRACLANCAPFEPGNPENGLLLMLTDVSEEARVKKELYTLNKKLEEMAHTDSLTRIANRRRFDQVFVQEWQRAQRTHTPLSFILLDIDYFKKFNDLYGHGKGDRCLYKVAQAIGSKGTRPADMAFRIGGEEFSVILPDTPFEGAKIVAEKIRSGVERLQIPHEASEISECITVSIGVCCANTFSGMSNQEIYQVADKAALSGQKKGPESS